MMRMVVQRVLMLLAITAFNVHAQSMRVVVRDGALDRAISGAVVVVFGSDGATIARAVTGESGDARLRANTPAARLRITRIGYRPSELPIGAVTGDTTLVVRLTRLPTLLQAVNTRGSTACPPNASAPMAFGLWEQAQAALLAVAVARESSPSRQQRYGFDRKMNATFDTVVSMRVVREPESMSTVSFGAARSPEELLLRGFLRDSANRRQYYGPDAEVLLSEPFGLGYCIALAPPEPSRRGHAGLTFTVAQRQRDRVDIRGTLWVDTTARALRDIEFDYIGLDAQRSAWRPGGTVQFREMPNGVVLVDRWSIRVWSAVVDTVGQSDGTPITVQRPLAREYGGELARASWPESEWRADLGTFNLTAKRSDGTIASGVTLALADTPFEAAPDSLGRVAFDGLLPGPYALFALDPALQSIDLPIPVLTLQAARASTMTRTVTVPTAEEHVLQRCRALEPDFMGDRVLLIGRAFIDDSLPVGRLMMRYALRRGDEPWQTTRDRIVTGSDGVFPLCLTPDVVGSDILISLYRPGTREPVMQAEHRLTAGLHVIRMQPRK